MFEKLGKFDIKRVLGQGAMGEVYLGVDPGIGREVAIKTILPSAASGAEAKARFEREAKAAGVLNHPNLVTIYEFGEDQGVMYIAMEFVRGHDLEELLRDQALARSEALEILAQVCDGLAFAHQNHIVHRDIKPSNVRVLRDGKRIQAKVMDFGVARVGNSEMTATGMVMGTVSYMAPEYIKTGRPDPRSDLFAIGVMLYEALSGRKPFSGDTTPTILYKIVNEAPEPIDLSQLQGISPAIRSVLDRALDKNPDTRYQTAEELAKALRAAKDPTWTGHAQGAQGDGTVLLPSAGPTVTLPQAGATVVLPQAGPTAAQQVLPGTVQLQPTGPVAAGIPPTLPPPAPAKATRSNTGLVVGVVGGLALLLLAGGGFAFWRWKQGQAAPAQAGGVPASGLPPAADAPRDTPPPAQPPPEPASQDAERGPASSPATPQGPSGPAVPGKGRTPKGTRGSEPSFEGAPSPTRERATAGREDSRAEEGRAPADPYGFDGMDGAQRRNAGMNILSEATALQESDPPRALELLKKSIAANPNDSRPYAWAVVILYRQGRFQECRDVLNKARAHGVSTSEMMRNAMFKRVMDTESFNRKIPG